MTPSLGLPNGKPLKVWGCLGRCSWRVWRSTGGKGVPIQTLVYRLPHPSFVQVAPWQEMLLEILLAGVMNHEAFVSGVSQSKGWAWLQRTLDFQHREWDLTDHF